MAETSDTATVRDSERKISEKVVDLAAISDTGTNIQLIKFYHYLFKNISST